MKNSGLHPSQTKNNTVSDAALIDLKPLLEDCMGDIDMLEELIGLYKNNILEFIGKSKIHLENLDYEGLQFTTHKLKCSLLLLKTQDLYEIVEKMNRICLMKEGTDLLVALYQRFLDSYPFIERAIDEQFINLVKK